MNGRYLRELAARRAARRAWRRCTGRAGCATTRRDLPGEDLDARRSSGRCRASSSTGPVDDPKAREKVLGRRARREALDRAREALDALPEPWTAEARRGGAARPSLEAERPQAEQGLPARCASRSPGRRSRPGSSRPWRCSGRDETLAAHRRARSPAACLRRTTALNHRSTSVPIAVRRRADDCVQLLRPASDEPNHDPARRRRIPHAPRARALRRSRTHVVGRAAQRGPRQAPDRRLRGARALPGARRVAQPRARAWSPRSAPRPATSSRPSSPTSRS